MASAIILDLDETLCHTFKRIRDFKKLKLTEINEGAAILKRCYILDFYDGTNRQQEHLWGIKRPHLDEFLSYCFSHWDYVIVYTAGTEDYAKKLVEVLFTKQTPHYIFDRKHCLKKAINEEEWVPLEEVDDDNDIVSVGEGDYDGLVKVLTTKEDYVKPIKKLLQHYPELAKIDLRKTLMLDNKENNFEFNKHMGIVIADYDPEPTIEDLMKDDRFLPAARNLIERKRQELIKMFS